MLPRSVAAGDINRDGRADLVICPDEGGGPRVLVYEGGDFALAANFYGIGDPGFRYIELGAGYYARHDPRRQTRSKIRELEKLNPGMTVTLTPRDPARRTPAA